LKRPTANISEGLQEVLQAYDQHRDSIIPILQGVQEKFGYISEDVVKFIAQYIDVSQSYIYGVATFYTQFRFTRPGDHVVCLCRGTACHVGGADQILEHVERNLGIKEGGTTDDGKFSLETVACIGCCALAPCMTIDQEVHGHLTPQKAGKILKVIGKEEKK
jgi:NADH-quinone oxidoreductase subunit E